MYNFNHKSTYAKNSKKLKAQVFYRHENIKINPNSYFVILWKQFQNR